ncbi:MAG: UDP-N-acetylglucosamine 2-epimerase, partial [Terracoccus sp.]
MTEPDRVAGPVSVAVFVGTRADLGPLSPVLEVLAAADGVALHVLTGVTYAADDLARALPATLSPEHWRDRVVAVAPPMSRLSPADQVAQGAQISRGTAEALQRLAVDVLLVLGDRWELLWVVPPAVVLGIPVVHLHGGEVTEGALDERVRHAVTKLADVHCVASADAAARLAQLGEPAERIHVTGAPGLDRLAGAVPLPDEEVAALLGVDAVRRPLAILTYHPPTARRASPVGRWAAEAASATLELGGTVIATHPGMDDGREAILAALLDLAEREPRLVIVEALGRDYPRVLAAADVVVGNSSSGIIEAASVHVGVVDVGERQRGRLSGVNVVHVAEGRAAVRDGLRAVLSDEGRARSAAVVNPYGAGQASDRILAIVRGAVGAARVKPFVDAGAPGQGPRPGPMTRPDGT